MRHTGRNVVKDKWVGASQDGDSSSTSQSLLQGLTTWSAVLLKANTRGSQPCTFHVPLHHKHPDFLSKKDTNGTEPVPCQGTKEV